MIITVTILFFIILRYEPSKERWKPISLRPAFVNTFLYMCVYVYLRIQRMY